MFKFVNSLRLMVLSVSLLALVACSGGSDPAPTTTGPTEYAVNVKVTGLEGKLILVNSVNGNLLTFESTGALTAAFNKKLADAADFSIAIQVPPDGQTCSIVSLNGSAVTAGIAKGKIAAADVTVAVTCTTPTNTSAINVTVTGLGANKSVGFLNNGGDSLIVSANGAKKPFTNRLIDGLTYSVMLDPSKQPIGQACNIDSLNGTPITNGTAAGTIAGADVEITVTCADVALNYSVSVSLSGLNAGGNVELLLNGNVLDVLKISANSANPTVDTFTTLLGDQQTYAVTFNHTSPTGGQPAGQVCSIDKLTGAGRVNAANVTVNVTCLTGFPIEVEVTGLTSAGPMVLQNNGGDDLVITANTPQPHSDKFFARPLLNGETYLVTIKTQPPNQSCSVTAPGTTVQGAEVLVKIGCKTTYSVSVNVAGFKSATPITVDDILTPAIPALSINADGLFAITTGLLDAATYDVQVITSLGQKCTLVNGAGTIAKKNVILPITCGLDADGDGILDGNDFFPADPAKHAKDSIVLSTLKGPNGFTIVGVDEGDLTGTAVSNIGDFNGDNIDDFAVTAPAANGTSAGGVVNQVFDVGETYIIFGKKVWLAADAIIDPANLNGTNGIIISGIRGLDQSGISVSGIGDINGDLITDILIGARNADTDSSFATGIINDIKNSGESYVVFGNSNWAGATAIAGKLNLSLFADKLPPLVADNTLGFIISGITDGDLSGSSVTGLGNIDTDINGYNDFAIGARAAIDSILPGNTLPHGHIYVIYGAATYSNINLSTIGGNTSTKGFLISGLDSSLTGFAIDNAGDINNDGIPDIIIGAPSAPGEAGGGAAGFAGETYVIFGKPNAFPATITLPPAAGVGVTFKGINSSDESGASVSGAGDVNADGFDDIIIGSKSADTKPVVGDVQNQGESYVVFGRAKGVVWPASINLSSLKVGATANGSTGFVIQGLDALDVSGYAVSGGGDVNGDGISDIVVGAISADPNSIVNAGETYVIFGRSDAVTAWPAIFDLLTLDGLNGFTIFGINIADSSGFSIDSAGDINQDGAADIIIGAPNATLKAGQAYVLFGCDYNYNTAVNVCVK